MLGLVIINVLTLGFCIYMFVARRAANKKPLEVLPAPSGFRLELIRVPPARMLQASMALFLFGGIFIIIGYPLWPDISWNQPFVYFVFCFKLLGGWMMYGGVRMYARRNNTIQLELGDKSIRYKPEKWYSISRTPGGVSGASAIFDAPMREMPYTAMQDIRLFPAKWSGSYIRVYLTSGKSFPLILVLDNNEQVAAVYHKIKLHLASSGIASLN